MAAILKLCQFKKTLKDDTVASVGFLLFVVSGTRIHKKTLYILRITLHPLGCRTRWWGACWDIREDVGGDGGVYLEVSCGVSGNMYVYSRSYNPHEIIIIIILYYIYIRLADQYLHIIYLFFFSHKCLTKLFLYNITFSSVSISIHECDFFTLFPFHFYFVIIHFTLLVIFIGLYYSASTCTCAIERYTVTYIYMYFLLMFNAVYGYDIIQVRSYFVQKGKRVGGGLSLVGRVYQTYTDYG